MTPLKTNIAILCEFLTESAGNKHTLVNVIPGDLVVGAFPARIPVAFYLEVTPKETEAADYLIEILFGKKRHGKATARVEFIAGTPGVIALPMGLLAIDEPGEIKITIRREDEGGKPITLLRKKILGHEITT